MLAVIFGWTFASFIYFKVVFDFAFSDNITIIASILLSVLLGFSIFLASGAYSLRLFPFTISSRQAELSTILKITMLPFIGIFFAYAILGRLIIFGFAKRLDRDIYLLDYRDNLDDSFISYMIIMLIPFFIHFIMCIFPIMMNPNTDSHKN